MKFLHGLRLFMIVIITGILCNPTGFFTASAEPSDAWWHEDWPYRVAVTVDGSGVAKISLNFTDMFTELGLESALLDLRSIRVVAYTDGIAGLPIPYQETYSNLFIDAESLNFDSSSTDPYWFGDNDTTLSLDAVHHTQGDSAIHTHTVINVGSNDETGFYYFFNDLGGTNWSAYETLLYDVRPEVNASAVDQTPDIYFFELGGLQGCPITAFNGPAVALNEWNSVSVSLKPYGNCIAPILSSLDSLRFFLKVNRPTDQHGYFDPDDEVDLWLDNFRLVDQDGGGEIRWQAAENIDKYYIYFDTFNHEGHPTPELTTTDEPTLTATHASPETGGYFHQISGGSIGDLVIWNAPPVEKILRTNQAPIVTKPLLVFAARGEMEPIQLVVNSPTEQDLLVSTSPLEHIEGGAVIPVEQIELFRIDYVDLERISDFYGRTVPWPDPLYPLLQGQEVQFPANLNQPLWLRISVPANAVPGFYTGNISIGSATIPISLKVWDFLLPQIPLLESKFGFDWDTTMDIYRGTINGEMQPCYEVLRDSIYETFEDYRLTPSAANEYAPPEDILLYSLTAYEIIQAQTFQTLLGEKVWWGFSELDNPPLVHPAIMDRQGLESRILLWLAWLDRIDGFYYPQTADWDNDPWTTPFSNELNNGDGYLFYPPKDETIGFNPCHPESNRMVPSIRLELLREGMEDYAYLFLLNYGKPKIGEENSSDSYANLIVRSRTAFNRIPTALDPVRVEIAELIEARQTSTYLPILIH